jgi:hypothetical protein
MDRIDFDLRDKMNKVNLEKYANCSVLVTSYQYYYIEKKYGSNLGNILSERKILLVRDGGKKL